MKTILWLAALIAVVSAKPDHRAKFKEYAAKHKKNYSESELPKRMALYVDRSVKIQQHNAEAASGLHSYTMEENDLIDNTDDELKTKFGVVAPEISTRSEFGVPLSDRAIPSSVDLRKSGCMPAVENQAGCGSCWAYAASLPTEFLYCKKYNQSFYFSKQQLVSCSSSFGNYGCDGGFYTNAWNYVKSVGGQVTAAAYPYTSSTGTTGSCLSKTSTIKAKISSSNWVYPYKDESAIAAAVATYGPVAVAIYANNNWCYYQSGIFDDPTCPTNGVNHAVVVVGYGSNSVAGKDFWIVRNSWGPNWGSSGYILMRRGVNMCNINSYGAYPTVA